MCGWQGSRVCRDWGNRLGWQFGGVNEVGDVGWVDEVGEVGEDTEVGEFPRLVRLARFAV